MEGAVMNFEVYGLPLPPCHFGIIASTATLC